MVRNLPASAGDLGSNSQIGKILWRRKWQPTPVFLPGKSHGQRRHIGLQSMGSQRIQQDLQLNNMPSFHRHWSLINFLPTKVYLKRLSPREPNLWQWASFMRSADGYEEKLRNAKIKKWVVTKMKRAKNGQPTYVILLSQTGGRPKPR